MEDKKSGMFDVNWQKVWPNRMPVILRDLAPTNPFNPRNLWPEEPKDGDAATTTGAAPASAGATSAPTASPTDKKATAGASSGKVKKADLIRMQLAKEKAQKQSKVDEEKLMNIKKAKNLLDMKMVTPTGRLKQLYEILRDSCKKKEYTDAVDTLWEIQRTKLVATRAADGRKKHEKQKKMDDDEHAKLQADFNAVHKKYRKYVKIVNDYLSGKDLIEWQLTEMSDRLPPLNMHHMNKFILDDWQRTVLSHIDQNHSVIVCAPTSSGKTVLSSYVSVVGGRVLFVVPTDPLAWQVAALFQAMVKGSVALITDGTVFLPPGFRVAVGTPRAVESTLIDIGYDFQYAVYDEVHDLNGPEGGALERIIKAVTCPFLALSATIGNAEKLKGWWESHHSREVHLLEYKGRFINLQRIIWHEEEAKEEGAKKKQEMVYLHPCAGVTLDYLTTIGFDAGDLAFTPRDAFALWQAMEKFYTAELIADVDPHKFFELEDEIEAEVAGPVASSTKKEKKPKKDKKSKKDKKEVGADDDYVVDLGKRTHRITLMESKKYEDKIKKRLEDLAVKEPKATQSLLDFFAPPASLQDVTVELRDPRDTDPSNDVDVYALVKQLCAKNLVPAIAFQLDSVRCRQLFNQLLTSIEAAETAKYPNFREKVQLEYAEWEKNQASIKKREAKVKAKGKEEDDREAQAFEEKPPPDIYAPHPDFVLTPPGSRLTATEFNEIKWQLRRELSEDSDDGHALVRSLRRGIAIYNQNLPAAYLRIAQTLAQGGRLAVMFSDDSLAYGVNMPFRTCCFCEDTADDVLTSLMVQQMAGRAGRRGLDRQGNILFAGLSWSRIQFLMRGMLPDVTGRKSLYPTIALQKLLSANVTGEIMQRIVSHPLGEYMTKQETTSQPSEKQESYLTKSVEWMTHFGLTKPEYSLAVDVSVAKLVWECRDDPSEALGIFWMLEAVLKEFHHKPGDNIALQLSLFNMLLRVVGRERFHPEYAHGSELAPLPGQEEVWDKMSLLLQAYEDKVNELGENIPEELRLRVDLSHPLDGYVFRTVVENLIPQGLGTSQLNQIKKRLRHVGDRLRLMHNLLMYSGRYGELEEIVRKCFRRIKWILIDSEV
ncbi:unnamed protein product [Hyaloperonospora brassicae]|uniref:Helicase ATP-binding domain-containing protein n=1 Tax=Hyaloperonospora brassicae TaxID=162125 RepID=A0AAV0UW11_HYABA|nr:unnamed protein product [Hyaloperonospora brassicae]